jgi:hypothetical protein
LRCMSMGTEWCYIMSTMTCKMLFRLPLFDNLTLFNLILSIAGLSHFIN